MQEEKFTRFKNEIWKDRNIKGNEKLVLLYLISYNNEALGYSFPTRKQIQDDTGISENTLGKILKSLIDKGYITKEEHKTKNGRNNIYYIHKYLVVSKKAQEIKESEDIHSPKVNENGREQLANELLINQKAKLVRKLKADELEEINQLDTDILIKAIDRANKYKSEGYHIGYLLRAYDSIKNNAQEPHRELQSNKTSNNSTDDKKSNTEATGKYINNNYPVNTKYHNSFNEHFRNYEEDELELKLLEAQARKRGLAI